MKFSHKALLAAAAISVVQAQVWCEEDEGCIGEMRACTDAPDDCCEGFECHGYNFFKRCQEMPTCLNEWYACNPKPGEDEEALECCDGLVCVQTDSGLAECQKPTSRTVELPGFNIEQHVEEVPEPPVPEKTFVCEDPVIHSAQLTGDPHFRTFDGLTYDCQGVGEHIIFKTEKTSREVQGRFTRVQNMDVSVTHGVAMRDQGGATAPKVQVSIPIDVDEETDDFTVLGGKGCKLQLFVDGEQHTLKNDVSYESDEVTVKLSGTEVTTLYKSGFKVKVTMGYWNGCLLNTYLTVPTCEGDSITGLLGDADGKANNDWITKTGERVDIPSDSMDRRRKPAYDWCVPNWCIVDQKESIFHYNEVGYDFGYYSRCALEYGTSLVEFMADLPADIVKRCDGNMGCMIDALADDADTVEAAIRNVAIDEFELKKDDLNFCTAEDGDCSGGKKCCDGLNCVRFSPFEHQCKRGITKLTELKPQCNPSEGGYCDKVKCCGDMECVEKKGDNNMKLWQCEKPAECAAEGKRCGGNNDCCGGMTCADPKRGENGKRKVCLKLPKISKKNDICFPGQACEAGLVCDDGNCVEDKPLKWGKKCFEKNWPKEKDCDEGLVCMPFKNRKVCADPGLKKDAKTLKKGAVCTIGDETVKCKDGYSCQKPQEKELKKFIKKYGDEAAMKIGQCKKVGAEKAIKEYREKKVKGGSSKSGKDEDSKDGDAGDDGGDDGDPGGDDGAAVGGDDRATLRSKCTPKFYRIKSTSGMEWEKSPGYGNNDCIKQWGTDEKAPKGTVQANGKYFANLSGDLKFQTADIKKDKCWVEMAGHKAGQGCFYAGKDYQKQFYAGLTETKFDTSKCDKKQDISHVEIIVGCCE